MHLFTHTWTIQTSLNQQEQDTVAQNTTEIGLKSSRWKKVKKNPWRPNFPSYERGIFFSRFSLPSSGIRLFRNSSKKECAGQRRRIEQRNGKRLERTDREQVLAPEALNPTTVTGDRAQQRLNVNTAGIPLWRTVHRNPKSRFSLGFECRQPSPAIINRDVRPARFVPRHLAYQGYAYHATRTFIRCQSM